MALKKWIKTWINAKIFHLCSWIGRVNILKISILLKAIFRFNSIPIKVSMVAFFKEIKQRILKFVWNHQRPQIAKAILRKNNKAGGIMLSHFKLNCKTVLQNCSNKNNIVLMSIKNRYIDKWSRIQTQNKPTHVWPINLRQRSQDYTMGKGQSSQ